MAAVSKEEYLKRYLSSSDSGAKKKRKKKLKTGVKLGTSLIIDDDVNLRDIKVKHEEVSEGNLLELAEENPLIFDEAGTTVLSKDLETIKKKEEARKAMWAPVKNVTEDDPELRRPYSPKAGETRHSTKWNKVQIKASSHLSSERKTEPVTQNDISPPRRQRHDSPSPERARTSRKSASSDLSPPRNGRSESPEILRGKLSPNNLQRGVSDDQSPPRRRARHDSSSDQSPPRRNKQEGLKTFGRRREETYSRSLHQKQKNNPEGARLSNQRVRHDTPDQSPLRTTSHIRDNSLSDQSPPRRHNNSDSERPLRKRNRHDTPDLSPSRKTVNPQEGSSSDQSPPRRNYSGGRQSPREGTRHSTLDQSPPRQKRSRDHGSPEGKKNKRKAGLHSAAELRRENELAKRRENEMFSRMSFSATGKGAETVHRDKEGRKRNLKAEKAKKKEEESKKLEEDEKFMEWGKGLQQTKEAKEKLSDDVYEMGKPLARYKDDKDLEEMLRDRDRAGDPMLAFMQKKKAKQDVLSGKKEKPKYKGPAPPPNRFNIQPGYRWDGVDRSNGFEKKRFAMLANKGATREEAYKWSTEDM